jgi:hypothetical protein
VHPSLRWMDSCRSRTTHFSKRGVGIEEKGTFTLFYMDYTSFFLLPLNFVCPVSSAHRTTGNVFGVTCLKSMSTTGIFFRFVFFFRIALNTLLTKSNGFYLSTGFCYNNVRFGWVVGCGFRFVETRYSCSCKSWVFFTCCHVIPLNLCLQPTSHLRPVGARWRCIPFPPL